MKASENEILTACALRFDGYAYVEATGFRHQAAIRRMIEIRTCWRSTERMMCMFFMLQRYLCKWGGETLPETSPEWWAYRELFLKVAHESVPATYRHEPFATEWDERYAPNLRDAIELIQASHERTQYDWYPSRD